MALRWDLRPVFPNAPEGSERETISRRTVISGTLATVALITVASWGLPYWQYAIIALGFIFAFDAGDTRVPFIDDEPDEIEDPDADRPLTRRELLYRPESER